MTTGLSIRSLRLTAIVFLLFGASALAQITISPSSISFGNQLTMVQSPVQYVTLKNNGTASASLTQPTITTTAYANYYAIKSSTCGSTLASGASCSVGVGLFTNQSGRLTSILNVTGGSVPLSAVGTDFLLKPSSINFGDVAAGQTVASSITMVTSPNQTVYVGSETFTGTSAADFKMTGATCSSVSPSSTCVIPISFTPSATGAQSATFTYAESYGSSQTVKLMGTGTNVLLSSPFVAFGWQTIGTTSLVRNLTVKNIGTSSLTMSTPTISGNSPGGSNFAVASNTCGTSLAPGATCTVGVTFTPHFYNQNQATLYIHDSDPSGSQPVILYGYGTQISISPVPAKFTSVQPGAGSQLPLTVKNLGSTSVNFSAPTLQGTNASDFSVAANTCATLAPSSNCTITLKFAPIADTGTLTATLNVNDSAIGSPQAVILTGTSVPTLKAISPQAVIAKSAGFTLTATGTGFTSSSQIEWNGAVLTTTFVSATELQASIPSSSITTAGAATITVHTATATPAVSNPLRLMVGAGGGSNYVYNAANQAANDLIADNARGVIYLSAPSTATAHGNDIAVLDPNAATVTKAVFAGSEPDRLALSDGGQYLYVGIDQAASVNRFVLPALSSDISISLGADSFGPYYAMDVEAAPANPHTVAVIRGNASVSPSEQGGIVVYDDAHQRTNYLSSYLIDDIGTIQWGSSASTLYGGNNETTGFDFITMAVNASGVSLLKDYGGVLSGFFYRIHFDKKTGYIYADTGQVVNPANGLPVGSYAASGPMVPDSSLNAVFFIGQTTAQGGSQDWTIESFNQTQFTPVSSIVVHNVVGTPQTLVRWGADGLAFNTDRGQVVTLVGSFVGTAKNQANPQPLNEHVQYKFPKSAPRLWNFEQK